MADPKLPATDKNHQKSVNALTASTISMQNKWNGLRTGCNLLVSILNYISITFVRSCNFDIAGSTTKPPKNTIVLSKFYRGNKKLSESFVL